jgi:hypothetical protein
MGYGERTGEKFFLALFFFSGATPEREPRDLDLRKSRTFIALRASLFFRNRLSFERSPLAASIQMPLAFEAKPPVGPGSIRSPSSLHGEANS